MKTSRNSNGGEVRMTIISLAFIDFLTYIGLDFGPCSTGDIESEELGLGVSC